MDPITGTQAVKMGEKVRRDGYISFRKRNYMSEKNLGEKVNQKRNNKKHVILIVFSDPPTLNLTEKFLKLENFETSRVPMQQRP